MAISLQEQLLKAGLTDEKKLKTVNKEKRKQKKQQRQSGEVDEVKLQAQQALEEKNRRSRELAQQQNLEAEKKAITAQIRQMVEVNRLSREGAEIPYNFTDGRHIKKIHVTQKLQDHLSRGQIAIVKLGEAYELVPTAIAEKISQRDPGLIILQIDTTALAEDEDDPYADYKIPDDLMW
jgi:uncharacterized protein YaiL (DUF2058 family)